MTPRLNPFAAAPALMQSWLDFGKVVLQSGLEDRLVELVKIRASQINGCAFCLHMQPPTPENMARRRSVYTCSMPGAICRSIARANALRSSGPKL